MVCIRQINLLILITQCMPTKKRARHRCRLADPASLLHLWSSQCEEPQIVCSTQWQPPEHGCENSNTVSTESHKNTVNSFPNQRKQKHYPRKKTTKNLDTIIHTRYILKNYTRLNVLHVISALQIFSISRKYWFISCSTNYWTQMCTYWKTVKSRFMVRAKSSKTRHIASITRLNTQNENMKKLKIKT